MEAIIFRTPLCIKLTHTSRYTYVTQEKLSEALYLDSKMTRIFISEHLQ